MLCREGHRLDGHAEVCRTLSTVWAYDCSGGVRQEAWPSCRDAIGTQGRDAFPPACSRVDDNASNRCMCIV